METRHLRKEEIERVLSMDLLRLTLNERQEEWNKWSKVSQKCANSASEECTIKRSANNTSVNTYNDSNSNSNSRYVLKTEIADSSKSSGLNNTMMSNTTNNGSIDWYLTQSETQPATLQMNEFDDDDCLHNNNGTLIVTTTKTAEKSKENGHSPMSYIQVNERNGTNSTVVGSNNSTIKTKNSKNNGNSTVRQTGKTWISPFPSRSENLCFFMFRYKVYACPYRRNCPEKVICELYHHDGERRRNPGSGPHFLYSEEACQQVKPVGSSKWLPQGRCANGDKCQYSHTILEQMYHPNIYKTSMCMNFTDPAGNRCKWGYYCTHAHGQDDVRTPINRRSNSIIATTATATATTATITTLKNSDIGQSTGFTQVLKDNNLKNINNFKMHVHSHKQFLNNLSKKELISSSSFTSINNNNNNNNNNRSNHTRNDMAMYPIVRDKFVSMTPIQQYTPSTLSNSTNKFKTKNLNVNTDSSNVNAMDMPSLAYSHYPLWSLPMPVQVSIPHTPAVSKSTVISTDTQMKTKIPETTELESIEPEFLEYLSRPAAQGGGIGLSDTEFETDDQELDLFPLNVSLPSPSPPLSMWDTTEPIQSVYPFSSVLPFSKQQVQNVSTSSFCQPFDVSQTQAKQQKHKSVCDHCGLTPQSVMQLYFPCSHALCKNCCSKDMKCPLCLVRTSLYTYS